MQHIFTGWFTETYKTCHKKVTGCNGNYHIPNGSKWELSATLAEKHMHVCMWGVTYHHEESEDKLNSLTRPSCYQSNVGDTQQHLIREELSVLQIEAAIGLTDSLGYSKTTLEDHKQWQIVSGSHAI